MAATELKYTVQNPASNWVATSKWSSNYREENSIYECRRCRSGIRRSREIRGLPGSTAEAVPG